MEEGRPLMPIENTVVAITENNDGGRSIELALFLF